MRLQRLTEDNRVAMYCTTFGLNPKLYRLKMKDNRSLWQLDLDFSRIPLGSATQIVLQNRLLPEMASETEDSGRYRFRVGSPTGMLEVWMLMPEDREYNTFEVTSYPDGKPELSKVVVPHSRVEVAQGSIATFRLVNPKVDQVYECHWTWNEQLDSK